MEYLLSILATYEGTIKLLITFAIVVERISEILITYNGRWFENFKYKEELTSPIAKQITTILVSIALSFSVSVVLFPDIGLNLIANKLLAAIVISLGSNVLHDLLKMLTEIKDILKVTKDIKTLQSKQIKR